MADSNILARESSKTWQTRISRRGETCRRPGGEPAPQKRSPPTMGRHASNRKATANGHYGTWELRPWSKSPFSVDKLALGRRSVSADGQVRPRPDLTIPVGVCPGKSLPQRQSAPTLSTAGADFDHAAAWAPRPESTHSQNPQATNRWPYTQVRPVSSSRRSDLSRFSRSRS